MYQTDSSTSPWNQIYQQVPLSSVPQDFANYSLSSSTQEYLSTILRLCGRSGHSFEVGVGRGYGSIWLSLRGILTTGIDISPLLVERAKHVSAQLCAHARFTTGDLFELHALLQNEDVPQYDVIHHQGVLEHMDSVRIRHALAQQVTCAKYVVFILPSVYYPAEPAIGDERLLPVEIWEEILQPFDIQELRLIGESNDHMLVVLRGQPANDALRALIELKSEPYPAGISAIVHTRNEARHIEACLHSLCDWTDEIIICDMESQDSTVELARPLATRILHHPLIPNFDRARNASAMAARFRWIFYLDADERVPPPLGAALRHLVMPRTTESETPSAMPFAALLVPFRHHFAGHWMRSLYPGYTAPRLLKNGSFVFNTRLHSGAQVNGTVSRFPADNPDLAIVHYSYDNLAHYLDKLNRYTDGEAMNLHRDGAPFHWTHAARDFVRDFRMYYEGAGATQDGVHGFLYSFLSGFYRFEQHAKLYERRFHNGQLHPDEKAIPASLEEMLEFMLSVARDKPLPAIQPLRVASAPAIPTPIIATTTVPNPPEPIRIADCKAEIGHLLPNRQKPLVWSGPLLDPSGYGEESRNFVLGLDEIGVPLATQILPWNRTVADMPEATRTRLNTLTHISVEPGFTQIVHTLAPQMRRHPEAGLAIGRTMFETDRLPIDWVRACQNMDAIWVPSEFHRKAFRNSGLPLEKLFVVPESLDPSEYRMTLSEEALQTGILTLPLAEQTLLESVQAEKKARRFVFLSVFDWTLHKGWDVLLRGFLRAFEGQSDVVLLLRVWSSLGLRPEEIRAQAAEFVSRELGHDLLADQRIRFQFQNLSRPGLCSLYSACDAFVLPSRGEGWGRPYMEAMACGKPTIGTNWSGNTAFMNEANSFLIPCSIRDVSQEGWAELPSYKGHRWAQPDEIALIETMQQVRESGAHVRKIGANAREEILTRFNRRNVAHQILKVLEQVEASVPTKETSASWSTSFPKAVNTSSAQIQAPQQLNPIVLHWEGAFFNWHSLSHVNRELCLALITLNADELNSDAHIKSGEASPPSQFESETVPPPVELSLLPTEPYEFSPDIESRFHMLARRCFSPLSRPAQVHVRHFFPPRFDSPTEGYFVLMQPWEYGALPENWTESIHAQVDQVWCNSQFVRRLYLESGIPDEKLRMVPLGIDPQIFRPDGPGYVFTDEPGAAALIDKGEKENRETFVFLYTGGTTHRKGIDILLEAYKRAFTRLDDVCLVIKDTGANTVYRAANYRSQILDLVVDAGQPPIVYLDADLSPAQLASVFRSADVLVQPYRGEGFCLPVLEAMACGTPVVVTGSGPTDDFVDETVGWRIEAPRREFGRESNGRGRVGSFNCVGPTWMFEMDADVLARQLRLIASDHAEVRRRGEAASRRVHGDWTWRHSARAALAALQELEARETLPLRLEKAFPVDAVIGQKVEKLTSSVEGKPSISLCMIVRDEERVLDECLTSAKPWFDEIILVDTGSTDRTVEIAQRHGAKVFHFPWCDDFSAARNESLRHAIGDWLFWMDADDTLPAECGAQLRDLAWRAEERTTGFIAQIHIPAAPGEVGFTVVDHVKLFRNLPELRFEGRIHEQILEPIHRMGGRVERSNVHIVHSGYDYSPAGQQKKRERDLTILEKDLADRPGHPFVLFNIGMTAYHMKEFDKAVEALEACLARSRPQESTVRKVYAMLAGCHLERREIPMALQRIERGLELYPHDPELLFRAGIIFREAGDLPRAERAYLTLLSQRESGHVDSLDVTMTGFKAHHNLALIYCDTGKWSEAETQFRAALSNYDQFVPSLLGLADLCLRRGRYDEVRLIGERLKVLAPDDARRLFEALAFQSRSA